MNFIPRILVWMQTIARKKLQRSSEIKFVVFLNKRFDASLFDYLAEWNST